ncbi:30S ribosomal protein S4 [Candidatus Woesearchaeota archaeon]|nr:30S ribosomal protein S4 [Candidatus Woesearchaeota archaeon]
MGSPKRQRKKFSTPSHPWQKERILREQELVREYGLKRKYEIWKMSSILKNFTSQAKNLITTKTSQSEKERSQLLKKLSSLGLIGQNAKIEDVLSLKLKDVMERRLQTLLYRKHLARTIKQARQFIVHQQVAVGDKKITAPSYLVPLSQENSIQFAPGSVFVDVNHPERAVEEKKPLKKAEGKKEKSAENAENKKEVKEPKKEAKKKPHDSTEKKTPAKESKKESREKGN